ncbi:unnamed protein product [Symbiodinium sp. CCMP2592]|nr:unnamed protein product [Symbiodinium sp. CCMP2592]
MSWPSEETDLNMPPEKVIAPFLRSAHTIAPKVAQDAASHGLSCLFVTFNALSIVGEDALDSGGAAGVHGSTGRVSLLDASLCAKGTFIAGIQEARTPSGEYRTAHLRRYSSGSLDGKLFGTEIWVASGSGWPTHSAAVLFAAPTYLAIRIDFGSFRLSVLAGHGPHRGHSVDHRTRWWSEVTSLCAAHSSSAPWVFLVDVNGRVGSITDSAIGAHEADEEDQAGCAFRLLIGKHQAWCPSTFESFAVGPGGTLFQKRSRTLDRSDFVAIPQEWGDATSCAEVCPEINAGHAAPDHFAACVQVSLAFAMPGSSAPRQIDPQALVDPDNAGVISEILEDTPAVSWQTNVNEHASILVDHVYTKLVAAFPLRGRKMRQSFLTQGTIQLHEELAFLRQALRRCAHNLSNTRLRCAWAAWRSATPWGQIFAGRWLRDLRVAIAGLSYRISVIGKAVRKSCRRDRNAYLAGLADQADQAGPAQVHLAINRLLRPRRFRRQGPTPLPRLYDAKGQLCQTPQDVRDTWRTHFAKLEGGAACSAEALVSECVQRQRRWGVQEMLHSSQLPAFDDLVAALRRAQPFKACGPDLIPPALCHAHPVGVAAVMWPLLLKVATQGSEPVGFKGGRLFHIPKPNATEKSSTSAHRGILVQPVFGKALHRAFRSMPVAFMEQHAPQTQLGSRQGKSHTFGFFLSRSFLAYARVYNMSAALIFLDLQAAYYAVIRELILGTDLSDESLRDVAASLNLQEGDLASIEELAAADPVLTPHNSATLLRALARELHTDTWFHVHDDQVLVRTKRGTRPGGSLADITFALLFARVLDRREHYPQHTIPRIPWSGCREIRVFQPKQDGIDPSVELKDIVFADDHAACVISPTAAGLAQDVRTVTGVTFDSVSAHGLTPNIGPKKSAAILVPRGKGSKAARDCIFGKGKGKLTVLRENDKPIMLDAVPFYRHLGSTIAHSGSLVSEVRHRLALARATFGEGRRKVFVCPQIALSRRVQLFRSHVLSALMAGSGAWPMLQQEAWHLFQQGLTALFRQLLRIPHDECQHWTRDQVYDACQVPSPQELLHAERLRFLGQMLKHAPDAAWALLQHHVAAIEGFTAACLWLQQAVSATSALGDFYSDWGSWSELIRGSNRLWKGLIRRALAWHALRRSARVRFLQFAQRCWQRKSVDTVAYAFEGHACLLCQRVFPNAHTWSSHASLQHGYRTKARRLARGRQCQACGTLFADTSRLGHHLGSSTRCRQSIERQDPDLLPVCLSASGHAQSRATAGRGVAHLPDERVEIAPELLRALQESSFEEDTHIMDKIREFVEPFELLRNTLGAWTESLPAASLRSMAEDVLLCFQVDLLCEEVHHKANVEFSSDIFVPDVLPLLRTPRPAGLPGLVIGSHHPGDVDLLDTWPGGGWIFLPLGLVYPSGLEWACVLLTLPPPPCACSSLWDATSCPLRQQRKHAEWLRISLYWLDLERFGRLCRELHNLGLELTQDLPNQVPGSWGLAQAFLEPEDDEELGRAMVPGAARTVAGKLAEEWQRGRADAAVELRNWDRTEQEIADKEGDRQPVTVLLSDLSPQEVGCLLRTCEAAGVPEVVLCDDTPGPPDPGVLKTSLQAEDFLCIRRAAGAAKELQRLAEAGMQVWTLDSDSGNSAKQPEADLFEDLAPCPPVALGLGCRYLCGMLQGQIFA